MRRLTLFNNISIDGFFVDGNNDMSWAHRQDPEFQEFTRNNASSGGAEMIFGRVTYQMMASFWPTPMAMQMNPVVAETMNSSPKIVFSRTLEEATWNNTRLLRSDPVETVAGLKQEAGRDLIIFGSGNLVSQLAAARLIDVYQFVVSPVVLGQGRTSFEGVKERQELKLTQSRTFGNGVVFLSYELAGA